MKNLINAVLMMVTVVLMMVTLTTISNSCHTNVDKNTTGGKPLSTW